MNREESFGPTVPQFSFSLPFSAFFVTMTRSEPSFYVIHVLIQDKIWDLSQQKDQRTHAGTKVIAKVAKPVILLHSWLVCLLVILE